jgi:hypothetical protein
MVYLLFNFSVKTITSKTGGGMSSLRGEVWLRGITESKKQEIGFYE